MSQLKTIKEAIEFLKEGRTLRYFYMDGSVCFSSDDINLRSGPYISIKDFLQMRKDGIIDCVSGVRKRSCLGSGHVYQEYSLINKEETKCQTNKQE